MVLPHLLQRFKFLLRYRFLMLNFIVLYIVGTLIYVITWFYHLFIFTYEPITILGDCISPWEILTYGSNLNCVPSNYSWLILELDPVSLNLDISIDPLRPPLFVICSSVTSLISWLGLHFLCFPLVFFSFLESLLDWLRAHYELRQLIKLEILHQWDLIASPTEYRSSIFFRKSYNIIRKYWYIFGSFGDKIVCTGPPAVRYSSLTAVRWPLFANYL